MKSFIIFLANVFILLLFHATAWGQDRFIEEVVEELEHVEEAEREGAGIYFGVDIWQVLGVQVGHQMAISEAFNFRLEAEQRLGEVDVLNFSFPSHLRRYNAFIDWNFQDSESFIYLGTAWTHGAFGTPAISSGIVWRWGEFGALRVGHEYQNLLDLKRALGIDQASMAHGGNHTLRVGFIHFFRRR